MHHAASVVNFRNYLKEAHAKLEIIKKIITLTKVKDALAIYLFILNYSIH